MGPKRERDPDRLPEPLEDLETLQLGASAAPEPARADRTDRYWLAGLLSADVLGLTGAFVLAVTLWGSPAVRQMGMPYVFGLDLGPGWAFAPIVIGSALAAGLGLWSVRQAARQQSPTWVRAVGGTAALAGIVLTVGTMVTWFYAVESGAFDQFQRFFG